MVGNAILSLIAVISENRVLARSGGIPWHIPEDIARYRSLIKNHIAILGRKTIDDSYTETENIVITSREDFVPPVPAHVAHSVDEAMDEVRELLASVGNGDLQKDEVFVLGGGEVFTETIGMADKLYLTIVHEETVGDTYFPDYSSFTNVLAKRESTSGGYAITFLDLAR